MRPKSAAALVRKWESREWYGRPSSASGGAAPPSEHLNLRLRRGLSWLARGDQEYERGDSDAAFVFYWIAFNAMYGQLGASSVDGTYERDKQRDYFKNVVAFADSASEVYRTIWSVLREPIVRMLENRYVFDPYWRHHNNPAKDGDWKQGFDRARERAADAIRKAKTEEVLRELFDRLYTLRNQLLHGGATWSGSVNREQVETGAKIMSSLVSDFIDVMIEHPDAGWGVPRYPVVRESGPLSGWEGAG